jgi:hypothetical protein
MNLHTYYTQDEILQLLKSLPLKQSLPGLEYDLQIPGARRWHFSFKQDSDPLAGLDNDLNALLSACQLIAYTQFEPVVRRNVGPEVQMTRTSVTIRVTKCPPNKEIPKAGRPHKDFCYYSVPLFDSHYNVAPAFYGELAESFGTRRKAKTHVFRPSPDDKARWFVIAFCQLPSDWEEDGLVFGEEVTRLAKNFLNPKDYGPKTCK